MRKYNIISGDGHLEVPPETWTKYAPAKYQDIAPKTVKLPDGTEVGRVLDSEMSCDVVLACDLDYDQYGRGRSSSWHYPDGSARPGTGDAIQRLQEQDRDGIDAEILYPAVGASRFLRPLLAKDPEAYLALVQAYNTWLGEEYCPVAPDRLLGNAVVPETGLEDAILEAKRCRDMGIRSMCLTNWPNGGAWYAPGDEKFFEAMVDLEMVNSPHSNFGASGPKPGTESDKQTIAISKLNSRTGGSAAYAISQLMYHIFDKVPKSMVYIGESFCSWIPFNMNRSNEYYVRYQMREDDLHLKKLPSEYYRDNMKFSFIHERSAMEMRYLIGVDLLIWGSDFPHTANTFPHSVASVDEMFRDVPEDERRQVLVLTPCELFGLDPDKEITPTPSR